MLPSASATGAPQEAVVPATLRNSYMTASLLSPSTHGGHDGVGTRGVFHRIEGSKDLWWTPFGGGEPVRVPPRAGILPRATGTDVLAYQYADGRVDFWDARDSTLRTAHVPDGLGYLTSYDNLVVAYRNTTAGDGTTTHVMHLLAPGPDGITQDVTVNGGPANLKLLMPVGADARSVFFRAALDGGTRMVAVDRETGQVQTWTVPLPAVYSGLLVSPNHVIVVAYDKAKVLVLPRADLSGAPAEVTLAGTSDGTNVAQDLAVVGDWLVNGTKQVRAQPITGGDAITLMPSSSYGLAVGPGGTAVKIGRTGSDDWGIQRIQAAADGRLVVSMVKALPKPPYRIQGLSLNQGRLVVTDYGTSYGTDGHRTGRLRTVSPSGTPEFSDASPFLDSSVVVPHCADSDTACSPIHGTPDGQIAWLEHGSAGSSDHIRVFGSKSWFWERSVSDGGRITAVSGRYLIYTGQTHQYVYKIGNDGAPAVTRTPAAAALSGDVLWTAAGPPGALTAYNLSTKRTTETVTTNADCTPTELQALGRWVYWTCDGRAGVFDRTTAKSVPVPADEAELGDGYVVTHDKQAGKLVLTTVADGTPVSKVVGDLPATGASQRDVRWTVDESGGNAAYVDDQERVHLVPSGVSQQPLRLLAPAENAASVTAREPDTSSDTLTTLLLSKPASGWRLTVRSKVSGSIVDLTSGNASRGELSVGWSGISRDRQGLRTRLQNGAYDWTLTVDPADGAGQPLEVRGTVQLNDGRPVRHDHVGEDGLPDGIGDLLTLSSSGDFAFQQGTGKGTFSRKWPAGGWSTKAMAVPFGDLNRDRCNDVLVRMADGSLRGYRVPCGQTLSTSTPYKKLGTGWNAYNVLTSPGDLTGDGQPDLLARKASTGDVYVFAAKSDGTLAAAKKIRSAWTGYKKVVGTGDLDGDGIGDVLAQDKAGTLYRYSGRGKGLLKERVKLFSNWGGSYNVVVGVGDITEDGKSDLVARDTSGNLYLNAGSGTGSFGARTKIGTGWQGYKGIF
ncbi:FG-GAP-like repeat-containing protein [Streptomyces collinus]|uniref:FG-GAP-like repeat-containing protein n=1 Tax=Streptomyces collinus TaxID=42684 RepID=UPI0033D9558F